MDGVSGMPMDRSGHVRSQVTCPGCTVAMRDARFSMHISMHGCHRRARKQQHSGDLPEEQNNGHGTTSGTPNHLKYYLARTGKDTTFGDVRMR